MLQRLIGMLAISVIVSAPASTVLAQSASYCGRGEVPAFHAGFATLKDQVGEIMGSPVGCEHPNGANGDTLQNTTTGLAFYRRSTNTPTFTDGSNHWALSGQGMAIWTGSSVDPPPASAPGVESLDCALIIYDPSLTAHSTTFESCSGSGGLSVDLHGVGGYMFANVLVLPATFAQVDFADVRKQVVQLPMDAGSLSGGVLLIERDQDGMFNVSVRRP